MILGLCRVRVRGRTKARLRSRVTELGSRSRST